MTLKIVESGLITQRWIKLDRRGVVCFNTGMLMGRRLKFEQVDYVLLSDDGVLSIGQGMDIYSVRTKPGHRRHRQLVDDLVRQLGAAGASAGPAAG